MRTSKTVFNSCANNRDENTAFGVELYCAKHGPYSGLNCTKFCPDFTTVTPGSSDPDVQEFNVTIAVDARANIKVKAKNPEQAKELALSMFIDYDCGDLEIIDTSPVNCEDEHGNLTDYN